MQVTDEMVEVAAKEMVKGFDLPWTNLSAETLDVWRKVARAALTAALPLIRGAVVEECASVCQTWADAVRANAPRSPTIIQAEMHAAAIRALSPREAGSE